MKPHLPALASVLSLLAFLSGTAGATILFREDFSGSGHLPLHGSAPDVSQGGVAWVADEAYFADGSAAAGSRRAYLPLGDLINDKRGKADAVFTLTARVIANHGDPDGKLWEGIGFWRSAAPEKGTNFAHKNNQSAPFLIRHGNSAIRAFRGPGPRNFIDAKDPLHKTDGAVDLRVVLDLTKWDGATDFGTVSHYAKLAADPEYTQVASAALDATNSSFLAVGMSGTAIHADYSRLELARSSTPGTQEASKPEDSSITAPPASEPAKFLTRLAAGRKTKIVTYGTSLTAGGAWVGGLESWLAGKYPGKVTVINSGMSGKDSIEGIAKLKTKVLDLKPDVVFIEFAMNDAGNRPDGSVKLPVEGDRSARANLIAMIDAIQAQNPDVEIILQTMNCIWDSPFGSGISATIRPDLAAYYQMYRDVAASRRLMLIDHHPNWLALQKEHPITFQLYVNDGVHPGADGIREVTLPLIKRTLSGGRPLP